MLFSSPKQNLIAYLRRGGLDFYNKQGQLGVIEFSAEVVQNLELIQPKELSHLIDQFIQNHQLSDQRVLLVLDDEVVFQKAVKTGDAGSDQTALKEFEEIVPFETDNLAIGMIVSNEQYFLFGANKHLCQEIAHAMDRVGNKVLAATPAAVYGLGPQKVLDGPAVSKLLGDNKLSQEVNFIG